MNKEQLRDLIHVNPDARQYFYSKADERLLNWLWQNGFLDVIKEKMEDQTCYGDILPELHYLVRMSETAPAKAVDIMLEIPISSETFNPVVVERFLTICRKLPANQLTRLVQKIRDERWIPLMSTFRPFSLLVPQYKKMFKVLADSKNFQSLLVLAEAVLVVRTQEERERTPRGHYSNPFYFGDRSFDNLSSTKVFEHLSHVDAEYREQTLDLTTKVTAEVIASTSSQESDFGQLRKLVEQKLGAEEENEQVFRVDDRFLLLNVDFFDLESGGEDRFSPEPDVRELAAVIKTLAQKLIGDRCDNPEAIRNVYEKFVGDFDNPDARLPDSQATWHLRLFVLSLCPEVFKDELKKALCRLFEVEQFHKITSGTEYKKALQKGFAALSPQDRRHYVEWVVEYFTQQNRGQEIEEKKWSIRNGSQILSMIAGQLTKEEKNHAKSAGFELDPHYQPTPSIGKVQSGTVTPRGPITEEEFVELSIAGIAEKLRNEWKPNELAKRNTSNDFLNPLNADGVTQLLKNDIPKRLQEYIQNAENFFEREVLDAHYTYSFLWQIQETIQNHSETASTVHWDRVIDLCTAIKTSGEQAPFERERRGHSLFDAWLVGWDAVHCAMTDVLEALLTEKNGLAPIDFGTYRDQIFSIVSYLLSHPDPSPEDEQKMKSSGDADSKVSDPFFMAINAVRGKAFRTFALFVDQDCRKFKEEATVKIADDVKDLYEKALEKENTRALMFLFGHHLTRFYFRDRDWIRRLLPHIFSQEPDKKHLYTAAWEGYLVNHLYEEMFFDPEIQKLYERGLALTGADYPSQQKHFKKPDESIVEHFALAFMHYKKFQFDHPLFKAFRQENNPERHENFVNFLGRSFISGNTENVRELLRTKPESKERLRKFWDWLLEHCQDQKPFAEFGLWINLENGIFEPAWLAERVRKTLEKTERALDFDHELTKAIVRLAQANPKDTLEIARSYLLEGGIWRDEQRYLLLYTDDWVQWKEAFKILYDNPETKQKTSVLINNLILKGGNPFWCLKEIVDTNGESRT